MKHIYCSIFGHRFAISKKVTFHVNEYQCKHCNMQLTTSGTGELIPLTPKFKEINSILERIHKRRTTKTLKDLLIFEH